MKNIELKSMYTNRNYGGNLCLSEANNVVEVES